jgi:hypothetical protein
MHPNAEHSHGDYRIAKLRSRVGARADVAIERGAAMSYDEIIAYALEEFTAARSELAAHAADAKERPHPLD